MFGILKCPSWSKATGCLMAGAVFALLSASGCATPDGDVGATYDPLTAFPSSAQWAWTDAENKIPKDGRIDREGLDRSIKSAVAAEFGARGYSEDSAGKVHYLLSYEVGIHTWMSHSEARAFGTLSILMREAASDRRVWLGFVRLQIDMSLTPVQRAERLRSSVARMLKNFPPAQPG